MKRVDSRQRSQCCGCTACAEICPHGAISMREDELGFLYPAIDESRCTDCGLCARVCAFHDEYDHSDRFDVPIVYGIRLRNLDEMARSQSGGAFFVLSEHTLKSRGVVYGAGFSDHFKVVHKRATTAAARDELRLSKYVQSDMRGIFPQVKRDLSEGKEVLFCGTPCQVAGLKAYLGKRRYATLLTVDLVCHCVPAPKIWQEYLFWLERRYKSKIERAYFRNKAAGWTSSIEQYVFSDGRVVDRRTFGNLFYAHYTVRESCANCPFTNLKRVGDVTIGDFWGWEKHHTQFADNKGVSLLLINSEKGAQQFESIKSRISYVLSNTEECLQPQLQGPIRLHPDRDAFVRDFVDSGFEYVGRRYGDMGWPYRVRTALSRVKKIIRKFIGK